MMTGNREFIAPMVNPAPGPRSPVPQAQVAVFSTGGQLQKEEERIVRWFNLLEVYIGGIYT